VAAVADGLTGYYQFINGQTITDGGTSAATPLWAGLIARASQHLSQATPGARVGYWNPVLYQSIGPAAGVFHDIVTGGQRRPRQPQWHLPRGTRLGPVHRLGHPARNGSAGSAVMRSPDLNRDPARPDLRWPQARIKQVEWRLDGEPQNHQGPQPKRAKQAGPAQDRVAA
jgi:hypothetical protein